MNPQSGHRNVLKRFSAVTALLATVGSIFTTAAAAAANTRPNIIFIMLDDMGYGDVPTYGQKHIQMPNVDKMVQEGIHYTNAYTGSPICAPTRSVLMTGKHTGHTRVRGNIPATDEEGAVPAFNGGLRQPLLEEDMTVGEVLKAAGYLTGITGKWGLGEPGTPGVPNSKGFDEWLGILNQRQAHSYYPQFIWRNREKVILNGNSGTTQNFVNEEHYVHDLFAEFALDFVREHGPKDDPFFLYLPYTIPHGNWQIPELEPYTQGRGWTQEQQVYASMLTRVDRDIGELFALLKELDIDEETIVFLCSDNGAQNRYGGVFDSSGPLRGSKRSMYDGGLRTVMIVRWPGKIAANAVSGDIWYLPDVLPTLAELAGANPPPGIDGVSVVPSLLSQPQPELRERPLYWEDHENGFRQAIRLGDWKAVRNGHDNPIELYDLAEDIGEQNNIAAQHPDVVADMEARFLSMRTPSSGWPSPLDPVEPPEKEPVLNGWLPLSEGEGLTAADHLGVGVSGQLQNFADNAWGSDEGGGYLTFTHANEQSLLIEGTSGAAGDAPRSVAAWIRTTQPGAIISWGNRSTGGRAWTMRIDPATNCLRVEVQDGFIVGSTPLTDDQWRHVAAVFDPGGRGANVTGVRLFVDGGEEIISTSRAQNIQTAPDTSIRVGGESERGDLYFSGSMRHVQWWNEALTPAAVNTLADEGLLHSGRWLRSHFPEGNTRLNDPAPGSDKPLILHYAAGRLPQSDLGPSFFRGEIQTDHSAEKHFILIFDPDPRARITARPVYSYDLNADWQDGVDLFETLPPDGSVQSWRSFPIGNIDKIFTRLIIQAAP